MLKEKLEEIFYKSAVNDLGGDELLKSLAKQCLEAFTTELKECLPGEAIVCCKRGTASRPCDSCLGPIGFNEYRSELIKRLKERGIKI